jgi:Bardet-Biedl syndrome 1 protein
VPASQPVSICTFYPDANRPHTPSVGVAAGPFVFIYRNLRPYYKFCLPQLQVADGEGGIWSALVTLRLEYRLKTAPAH